MISDLDIWRAAHMLITRYGAQAMAEAAKMLDKMVDDPEGRAVWLRIRQAIAELQAAPTGPVH